MFETWERRPSGAVRYVPGCDPGVRGTLTGSRPDGFTTPVSTWASAVDDAVEVAAQHDVRLPHEVRKVEPSAHDFIAGALDEALEALVVRRRHEASLSVDANADEATQVGQPQRVLVVEGGGAVEVSAHMRGDGRRAEGL